MIKKILKFQKSKMYSNFIVQGMVKHLSLISIQLINVPRLNRKMIVLQKLSQIVINFEEKSNYKSAEKAIVGYFNGKIQKFEILISYTLIH